MCTAPITRHNERRSQTLFWLCCCFGLFLMSMPVGHAVVTDDFLVFKDYQRQIKENLNLTAQMIAAYGATLEIPWEYSNIGTTKLTEIALDDQIVVSINKINLDLTTLDSIQNVAIKEITLVLRRDLVYDQNHRGQIMSTPLAKLKKIYLPVISTKAVPRQGITYLNAPLKITVSGERMNMIIAEFNRQTRNDYSDFAYRITDKPFLRIIVAADGKQYLLGIPLQAKNNEPEETWIYDINGHRPKAYAVSTVTQIKRNLNPYLPNQRVGRSRLTATYNDIVLTKRVAKALAAIQKNWKASSSPMNKKFNRDQISTADINTGTIQQLEEYQNYIYAYRTPRTPSKIAPPELCVNIPNSDLNDPRLAFTAWQEFLNNVEQLLQQLEETYSNETTAKLSPGLASQIGSAKGILSNLRSVLFELNQSWVTEGTTANNGRENI